MGYLCVCVCAKVTYYYGQFILVIELGCVSGEARSGVVIGSLMANVAAMQLAYCSQSSKVCSKTLNQRKSHL